MIHSFRIGDNYRSHLRAQQACLEIFLRVKVHIFDQNFGRGRGGKELETCRSLIFANVTVQSTGVTAGSDGGAMFCSNAKMSRIRGAVKSGQESGEP